MGFLDRLRGIPDESAPPAPTQRPAVSARSTVAYELGPLPQPNRTVWAAIESGQILAAIKAYREQSGAGLAESKHVVDAIMRGDKLVSTGGSPPTSTSNRAGVVGTLDQSGSIDQAASIDQLIRDGQLIAAIKMYRDQHGSGLKEAKDAVEARRDILNRSGS